MVGGVGYTALAAGYEGGRGKGRATLGSHPYLLSSHVDQQLCAIGAEGHIGGDQHSQTVVVVGQLHWQVTCREQPCYPSVRLPIPPNVEPLLYELGQLCYMLYLIESLQPHFTEKKLRLLKGKFYQRL